MPGHQPIPGRISGGALAEAPSVGIQASHSVIVPHGSKATAGWFSQGIPQESRDFATWHDAMRWLEGKLVTLQLHSWHVEDRSEG